ncbi:molybdate ABC transporter permease subunit [Falsiroseomonas sp.]|uniref:molybdate ABC transporter permease subunit n=1 Tax=Falsiroseomonas sp. TaxID=2870721 RepID=UPI0027185145|nr:molybdate ABC transporter permease subunit [Falsiroseomonas sp.]MDO9499637.1 molybdate ABC transporter permease subunit [Falsiroseomonas sp.]
MDWTAFRLSVVLALWTLVLLVPFAIWLGRVLAYRRFPGRGFVEAAVALPLVLPPTVVGFYLLVSFGNLSPLGQAWQAVFGHGLAFSFEGLLFASVLVNLPFAVQPIQNAFAAIPDRMREAGATSGMPPWLVFLRIELPLAWPGIATATVLTFAHTLGEFGVVLMVGGAIPGETQTIAIAIYDRVQAFDERGAAIMSAVLLGVSVVALGLTNTFSRRVGRKARNA